MEKNKYCNKEILLGDLKNGVMPAFTHVFNCYFNELNSYIAVICGNQILAQEIVQQTFVKFWDKRKKLVVKDNIKRYLFKMAYNLYKDLQKQNTKELTVIKELQYASMMNLVEKDPEETERKLKLLNEEIEKLPKKCKTVFLLAKKGGLEYKEIAFQLNISVKTVEVHISKAMLRLKNTLNQH
ncbi:sigma-70 family RNA polymerase sigma factor [Flagellimonas sp. 389]|uniref:RNA polymerase sigma factor n=1 Tax=Flagellimonas sp. 389 TaxID=2835862 RepID=UPI001BD5ED6F|nr:sigma-70 family RNA polymerase sigma factor [Flagellimonas sp. 389]MBS9462992.1 sigma-70 family RNA polymerase sigma factor [Flagellimonas sp. 389]